MSDALRISRFRLNSNRGTRFAFAVICVFLAWLVRWALDPYMGGAQPFSTFFVATIVVAWWAGWRAAVGAAILGFFLGDWSFSEPRGTLILEPRGWLDLGIYALVSGPAIWLTQWARIRERRASEVIKREQTDEALRAVMKEQARRIQLETLLETVPVPVWIGSDPQCLVLSGNPAAYHLLDMPVGANLSMSAPEGERPQTSVFLRDGRVLTPDELPIQTAARTGQPIFGAELEIRFNDGRSKWILGNAVPLRDDSGVVLGAVGAFMEITEQKQLEARLREAKEQLSRDKVDLERIVKERTARLQETVNELEYFSYSITHDMRAPLRAMQGYSELLLKEECCGCPKSQAKDYLRRIMASAVRMDALIMDALSYNDLTRRELVVEPVDVGALLREMVESYPNLQPHREVITLEGNFPLVSGNRAALIQCFSILLGNAIKFADPAKKLRIRVWAETIEGSIRLWFEDNAIGIPPEWQGRIFEMFQKVNAGDEGTGIGLALLRKAVQKMGGQVGVESELAKGSRFWVQLASAEVTSLVKN